MSAATARMRTLANVAAFQAGWFACVLGAAHERAWAGSALALAIVAWHVGRARQPQAEAALVLVCAVTGACWDSLLAALGWIAYRSGVLIAGTAPYWIVALWMLFATTLNASLSGLRHRPWLAAGFGALGGPLAYWGGAKLGALELPRPAAALAALAAGWAVLTPALLCIAGRLGARPGPAGVSTRRHPNHA